MFDVEKAAVSKTYCDDLMKCLKNIILIYGCLCRFNRPMCGDLYDQRLDNFAPQKYAGKPKKYVPGRLIP
jgi:hypothetical protein